MSQENTTVHYFFLKGCEIPGYFYTRFATVVLIEPILQKFEDLLKSCSYGIHLHMIVV